MKKILAILLSLMLYACSKNSIGGKYLIIACDYKGIDCLREINASFNIEDNLNCLLDLNYSDGSKVIAKGKLIETKEEDNYIVDLETINEEKSDTKLALGYDSKNDYLYLRMNEDIYYIFAK